VNLIRCVSFDERECKAAGFFNKFGNYWRENNADRNKECYIYTYRISRPIRRTGR